MSPRHIFATAQRILYQVSHDRRTLLMIMLVPCILLIILKYVFQAQPQVFERIGPMILGIFPLTVMFVITSIATLRERTSGTLDRLMTMPPSKIDFIFGYSIAFGVLASIQALLASVTLIWILGQDVAGGVAPLLISTVASGLLGTALGLFMSAFATSEFQAVQFMPAFILPQLLICGLFVNRADMAQPLQWLANVMPLTYSVDAMQQVAQMKSWTTQLSIDLLIVAVYGLAVLILASVTIRRQEI